MILQTIKKGVRNDTFEESQVIQCFDVIIEKDMLQISNVQLFPNLDYLLEYNLLL